MAWVCEPDNYHLLLARAATRAKELATRLSIGATRGRIIAQLLTESCVLALLAATASLLIARWTMDLFRTTLPDGALFIPAQLDAFTFIVTGALAVFASVAVGLSPALRAARPDLLPALRGQGQPSGDRGLSRSRMSLATVQVTLSVVLVVLAGLFTKSLANIARVDPGLNTDGLVTFCRLTRAQWLYAARFGRALRESRGKNRRAAWRDCRQHINDADTLRGYANHRSPRGGIGHST